jgi:CPA2 family monovalent cation:H+ antiporter-2
VIGYDRVRPSCVLSSFFANESDEIVLLTKFETTPVVAGLAEHAHVSSAIGAFPVGIAASGPIAEQSHRLLAPLRDFFATMFFFFFGLQIDPAALPKVLPLATGVAIVTALAKVMTGYWAARRNQLDARCGLRAGVALAARREFSIVIAGLGSGLEPQLSGRSPRQMCSCWRSWGRCSSGPPSERGGPPNRSESPPGRSLQRR